MHNNKNKAYWILSFILVIAIFSRLLPHPPNFTPVGGAALFAGAFFHRRFLAFLIPLAALFVTDLLLNNIIFSEYYTGFTLFTQGALWIYLSYVIILLLGMKLFKKINILRIAGGSVLASIIFFVLSNIGSWLTSGIYPLDASGLIMAYIAAIPFYWNTLAGDVFYTTLMFGAYYLINSQVPLTVTLQTQTSER